MIVYIKAYSSLNLGDDLFFKILFERYPTVLFLLDDNIYNNKLQGNYSNVKIYRTPNFFKFFLHVFRKFKFLNYLFIELERIRYRILARRIDSLLFIGGSIFMQNEPNITLQDKINALIIDSFNGKPKCVIGANFGPFIENEFYEFYLNLFSKCDDVCFRDLYSKNLFSDLSQVRVSPDLVFQLQIFTKIHKNRIGFSMIDLSNRKNIQIFEKSYLLKISELICEYIKKGFEIYLFSFCSSEGDENAIENVLNLIPQIYRDTINLVYYNGNIDLFLKKYLSIELMYTTRFHAMILSLMAKQKICPIAYSDKMINVINDISLDIKYYKIVDFINEPLNNIISNVISYELPLDLLSLNAEKQFEKLDLILK